MKNITPRIMGRTGFPNINVQNKQNIPKPILPVQKNGTPSGAATNDKTDAITLSVFIIFYLIVRTILTVMGANRLNLSTKPLKLQKNRI